MTEYQLSIVHDGKQQINSMSNIWIESEEDLYNADVIVNEFFKVKPQNTVIVSDTVRCVTGDSFVVLVTKII